MLPVHVRINDAATGQPTAVRLRITGPDGTYCPPLGRLAACATGRNEDVGGNLLLGRKAYAYVDGTCEVPLPGGALHVEMHKGFEYLPQRIEVSLPAGKLALRLQVERWCDSRREGWYSGDARAHFLSPHGALLEAAAEDLAVVNLLAMETMVQDTRGNDVSALPNILAFSGQQPCLEMPGHLVVVNTLNQHPVLGRLGLLNCHRLVYPLSFGGPRGMDDWSLADWCDQCHRKGGLVVWTFSSAENPEMAYGEALADLLLGKIDALEIGCLEEAPFDTLADWYRCLNAGLRLPLVGASGKDCNAIALGTPRTYANLPAGEPLTYKGWIEALRAGRTFVTSGPILTFTVADQGPGARIAVAADSQAVRVRVEARSAVPFDRLELVCNGRVIADATACGEAVRSARIEVEVPAASGWLAARCRGEHLIPRRPASPRVVAHTSPIYLDVEGQPQRPESDAVRHFLRHLDRMLDWVRREARCTSDARRAGLAGIFQAARDQLTRAIGERPT